MGPLIMGVKQIHVISDDSMDPVPLYNYLKKYSDIHFKNKTVVCFRNLETELYNGNTYIELPQ